MQGNNVIGGEFEIDLSRKGAFLEMQDTYYYASGRSALYHILSSVKVKRVWLPDYLCISVVEAVRKSGIKYVFYELDDNLDPKFETLAPDEYDAVLLIDYFGLKDLSVIENKIATFFPYTVLIEDDVQALYDFFKPINPYVHFRFTSLRKSLPVPDGGLVNTKHRLLTASKPNTFSQYKLRAGELKYNRSDDSDDSEYLSLFEKGEDMIDENYESVMSSESKALFSSCNISESQLQRKINSRCLLNGLAEIGVKTVIPVQEEKTPLFIPVYLEYRNKVRKAMFQYNIFCPVHWPLDGMPVKKGAEMAEHELSLIVDQRYTADDMNRILNILVDNL